MMTPMLSWAQGWQPENPVRMLALGDSYTIGQGVSSTSRWPLQLLDSLETRGFDIDTLRITATTGWRTDNLIQAIRNQHLEDHDYNLVSLLIGVNNQYQSRPFSQYIDEFPALLDSAVRFAGGEASRVFVVSIPDYAYTPFGQSADPDEISMELDEYNAYNRHVADSMGITYFDITPISRLGLQFPAYVANDGLHPSGVQYTEWVKLILDYVDNQTSAVDNTTDDYILDVIISPNPASDMITITLPNAKVYEEHRLRMFDLSGRVVAEQMIYAVNSEMQVDQLPRGLYIVKIHGPQQSAIVKLFVE